MECGLSMAHRLASCGVRRAAGGGRRGGRRDRAPALLEQRMVSTSSCAAHGVDPEQAGRREPPGRRLARA